MPDKIFDIKVQKSKLRDEYLKILDEKEKKAEKKLNIDQVSLFKNNGIRSTYEDVLYTELLNANNRPSEVINKRFRWMFGTYIDEKHRDIILKIADNVRDYPYSTSLERRSYRSSSYSAYASYLINVFRSFSFRRLVDAPLDKVILHNTDDIISAYIDSSIINVGYNRWQIAYYLDSRDKAVEDAVKEIITEQNGNGSLTYEIIKGVLLSHRTDFHKLIADLLVAARLEEGLRQAICENADSGTVSGFYTILKAICDNGLVRFSSVKRAVGTWIGVYYDGVEKVDRIANKLIGYIIDCFDSPEICDEFVNTDDCIKMYAGLWRYSFDKIENVFPVVENIVRNGNKHQLLTVGMFIHGIDLKRLSHDMAKIVLKSHTDIEILAVWLTLYLSDCRYRAVTVDRNSRPFKECFPYVSKEEAKAFYELLNAIFDTLNNKKIEFFPCVFPWSRAEISKNDIAVRLITLAVITGDDKYLDKACAFIDDCDIYNRCYFFAVLLAIPRTEIQRAAVIDGLANKEGDTRNEAFKIASSMVLSCSDYLKIEGFLRSKNTDIRTKSLEMLKKQDEKALESTIYRLLQSSVEDIRLGGLDLLISMKKGKNGEEKVKAFLPFLEKRYAEFEFSTKEKAYLDTILPQKSTLTFFSDSIANREEYIPDKFDENYTKRCVSVFKSYFPESNIDMLLEGKYINTPLFAFGKKDCDTAKKSKEILLSLSAYIEEHLTASFTDMSGETRFLNDIHWHSFKDSSGKIYFKDLWDEWIDENKFSSEDLFRALIVYHYYSKDNLFNDVCKKHVDLVFGIGYAYCEPYPHFDKIGAVLNSYCDAIPEKDKLAMGYVIAIWYVNCVHGNNAYIQYTFENKQYCLPILLQNQFSYIYDFFVPKNDDDFEKVFPVAVAASKKVKSIVKDHDKIRFIGYGINRMNFRTLSVKNVTTSTYLYAAFKGYITRRQLFGYLMDNIGKSLETVSVLASLYRDRSRAVSCRGGSSYYLIQSNLMEYFGRYEIEIEKDRDELQFIYEVYNELISFVLSAELSRGDGVTEYSGAIRGIKRLYGIRTFVDILLSLGNDTMDRTAVNGFFAPTSRKSVLSYLLSVCIPAENDSIDTFKATLKDCKISEERLIEAAMLSPEWIGLVGEYLNIPNFESLCYYFMAHTSEAFDNKRKAVISRYTALSEEELHAGAFDIGWFFSVHSSVDEKNFAKVYTAAKYISDGARHTRARKYADAATGKLSPDDTEKNIFDKRNKDTLMAYALIPIKDKKDLLHRYDVINTYKRESKRFGSQRSTAESRAAETALRNLALNAGYTDVTMFSMLMESDFLECNRNLLEAVTVDNVVLNISFATSGECILNVEKNGKILNSIPAGIKKNETVVNLVKFKNSINEQRKRIKWLLEEAMETGISFRFSDLKKLFSNPGISPILKTLVWEYKGSYGFLGEDTITDTAENSILLDDLSELCVCHPYYLYKDNVWINYQKYIFDYKILQPFRQVFREVYIKTTDEKGMYHSLRYSGNQLQPAKTVSVLKTRRWIADENGLQKVYYNESIVAVIYALADWFSPADIESPTLEWVVFYDTKSGKEMIIDKVPDVIFSEVMRDVDMAVSVAHAGKVDPEASYSTVEMRSAVLARVLTLFKLSNVTLKEKHAIISGTIADYSVHLGSGVVHQIGGAMIPILPVHSQHRGRIFLPFMDDDPKTAEIVTKVLIFADDKKIKDPSILSKIIKLK